jgi:hypothetical protein
MSVVIVTKVRGDTDLFRKQVAERGDDLAAIGARARTVGALHHRFGVGDGFVLVIDEWESPQQFQEFFGQPEIQALIAEMGGVGEPEITITEAISSPDEF